MHAVQRDVFFIEISVLEQGKSIGKSSKLYKLNCFLDDKGLLRTKSRLEYADLTFDAKNPIIIPSGHFAKLLISFQHHLLKHAGISTLISTLRSEYHIFALRKLTKGVINSCVICKRIDARPCTQPLGPLPEQRVNSGPPFSVTGMDFAGPVYSSDFEGQKLYVLLFTCGITRALHLELTESLNLHNCMLALRRFIARRGLPNVIYSDNARTFVAASIEITKLYEHLSPQWKFIPPRSPWWGGWWERLVRSVKSALKKTLGLNCVSKVMLETLLCEVEASVNSRPLMYVSDGTDEYKALSPSLFLLGRDAASKSNVFAMPTDKVKGLADKELELNKMYEKFWSTWSSDYITSLPKVAKGFTNNCNLKKGSVVLIGEENLPRLQWSLGLVTKVHVSRDGIIRTVDLKTSAGNVTRTVQRLYDLEIFDERVNDFYLENTDVTPSFDEISNVNIKSTDDVCSIDYCKDEEKETAVSRSGRVVKLPARYR